MTHRFTAQVAAIVSLSFSAAAAGDPADGFELARTYCGRCHGEGDFQGSATFSVIDTAGLVDGGYVVPGEPDESFLWQRIESGEMPPRGQNAPSAAEKAVLKAWVAAGVPKPRRAARPFVAESDLLKAIQADLLAAPARDRRFRRYFSLAPLHNNVQGVSAFDLRLYRAALAKALNSLTWERDPVAPTPIDAESALFAVDLRDLGWDAADWQAILAAYPYGLRYDRAGDERLAELAGEVERLCASPVAHVRGDWFAVTATRPPLYHRLLDLPDTAAALEARLGVDTADDVRRDRSRRAGFSESGVSVSNRLVERHPAADGYYWRSFDFRRSNGTGSLFQFPLGPAAGPNDAFRDFSFVHDGGEIIFSLPNGLQGYLLVDGQGNRIDAGPIDVVRDLKETAGTPVVVNGVSCMHCHREGIIPFRDSVRAGLAVFGDVRKKALRLYPPQAEMDGLIAADRGRYVKALDRITGRLVRGPGEDDKPIGEFGEPIGAAARFLNADVTLETAAYELGLSDPGRLKAAIEANPELRRLGLGPLAVGRTIDRQVWEHQGAVVSPMQHAARSMDLATPYVTLGGE